MIIEKTVVEGNRYNVDLDNYVAEGELTVTITLNEYRDLIKTACENKQRKEHESWVEQYSRANTAENRVKELEAEVSNLYKRLAESADTEQTGRGEWIPCSERLPANDDWVIISILDEIGDTPYRYSDFGWYLEAAKCWIVESEQRTDVVAWMPLPKPYGEREGE